MKLTIFCHSTIPFHYSIPPFHSTVYRLPSRVSICWSQVISDTIIRSWGCTVFVSLTVALITTDTSLQSTSRFVHVYYNFSQYFYVWYYRSQQLQRYLHVSFIIMLNGNYSYLFLVSSSHDGCISSQTHLEEWILSTICYHRLSILLFISFLLLLIWVINNNYYYKKIYFNKTCTVNSV